MGRHDPLIWLSVGIFFWLPVFIMKQKARQIAVLSDFIDAV
jgi:hypothetical protein